jgi:hypothetical protein
MFLEIHPLGVIHDGMDQRLHLLVIRAGRLMRRITVNESSAAGRRTGAGRMPPVWR